MVEQTWELIAIARSGQVELEIDESINGELSAYMLTLKLPFVELRWSISDRAAMEAFSTFAKATYGKQEYSKFELGFLDGLSVCIHKDNEHSDRYFIRAGNIGMIDITIVDPITSDLVRAISELADQAAENKPIR